MIYLDHNATSPLLEEVWTEMEPWRGVPANPASAHRLGQRATVAVEFARDRVAALVGGEPSGVVFTSGATEANHLYLRGAGLGRLALAPIEHPCVRAAAAAIEGQGTTLSWLAVDSSGQVVLDAIPDVDGLSLMAANHETGVIQPLERALAWAASRGTALHVDATQAAGRIPLALGAASAVVLSSHKLGGPAGVGALILPGAEAFPAQLTGGGQERGRRSGSANVMGIVGFGAACAIAARDLEARRIRWTGQRERLEAALERLGARIVGREVARIGNTVCCVFREIPGELLVQVLDLAGLATSHGAACASGSLEPSPVLLAMGEPDPEGALRISLGPETTDTEIDEAIAILERACPTLR